MHLINNESILLTNPLNIPLSIWKLKLSLEIQTETYLAQYYGEQVE